MGWKSVAWTSCLFPVLAGCGSVHLGTTESRLAHTQRTIEHDLRQDAHVAWRCVREQHPRRAFTDEFHDGFLDGYVDYLDRGGSAQPPAVPPIKYVRHKKYFTPEGQCLIRDYYLGFKYGADVAVASGRRQFLTVPVLLPDASCAAESPTSPGAPVVPFVPAMPGLSRPDPLPPPRPVPDMGKFGEPKKKGSDDPLIPVPPGSGIGIPKPIPPLPKPELPVIKPFNPDVPGGKFAQPQNPDLLPIPDPPLPVPESRFDPLPVPPSEPPSALPIGPNGMAPPTLKSPPVPSVVVPSGLKVTVPAPPDAVPLLPPSVPTPSVLDDIPVIPFRHVNPAPLPAGNLFPPK